MEFNELIRSRESIRNYDPTRPMTKDVLEIILDAGRMAPSACNYQPWKFLVISSTGMLEKVRAGYKREWFKDAPQVIVVLGSKNEAWNRSFDGYNSIETDVAIAITHLLLAAENEGIGACWVAAYDPDILNEAINPGENEVIFGIMPLGYQKPGFKKSLQKRRKPLDGIVKYL
jgi:nitroreductase